MSCIAASTTVLAAGSDTILEHDPVGIYVTIISVGTVLIALIVLFFLIAMFGKLMMRAAQKKSAQSKGESAVAECSSVVNGEVIAAITLALKLDQDELHDCESEMITINKVARVYSPWSSKIHGLTHEPERVRK